MFLKSSNNISELGTDPKFSIHGKILGQEH